MKLTFNSILGKQNVLRDAGSGEPARQALFGYCHSYGFDLDRLSWQARDFFYASQVHHARLAYRDAIARCLGLNMQRPDERKLLWEQTVEALNPYRRYGVEWKTGQTDMPLDSVRAFAAHLRLSRADFIAPSFSDEQIPSLRLAIARTVTYLRVFPPRMENGLPDADVFPAELERCWKKLRRHPHYRNARPPDLNQHALDSVADEFQNTLWIKPEEVGQLKRALESDFREQALIFWFWPFAIFKYATLCKIVSRNHNVTNPLSSLWNIQQDGVAELWGA